MHVCVCVYRINLNLSVHYSLACPHIISSFLSKAVHPRMHTHAHTHTDTHTHTHTHTHIVRARARARNACVHAHTHTHTRSDTICQYCLESHSTVCFSPILRLLMLLFECTFYAPISFESVVHPLKREITELSVLTHFHMACQSVTEEQFAAPISKYSI